MNEIIASILLAGIGSAITFAVQYVRQRHRDVQLRRRYPAAGLYVTEFEDKEDGRPVLQKALTRLHQRGLVVTGVTSELQSGRSWELHGNITPGGFINGIYTAEDPHDTGSGTFFVEIEGSTGDMEGLWAGYDSLNHSIEGGRYSFRRCPQVTFRPAVSTEAQALVALLGDALGDRYVELEDLERLIDGDKSETCFVADLGSGQVAGAATVRVVSQNEMRSEFPVGQEAVFDHLPLSKHHQRLGLVKAVAVSNSYRQRGIATQLTGVCLEWLRRNSATIALSIGWKSPKGCHIEGVFKSCGFSAVHEAEHFWREESREMRYRCPACGEVCECSAVVFSRPLLGALPTLVQV